ncbi:MAG: hypothetical protein AAF682_26430 [Planctomycetota bacterium]
MKRPRASSLLVATAFVATLALTALPRQRSSGPPPVPAGPAQAPPEPTAGGGAPTPAQLERQQMRAAELVWGPSPFRPLPAVAAAPTTAPPSEPAKAEPRAARPRLSGTSSQDDRRWAIIGHEIVREGDFLGSGYEVADIQRGRVVLRRGEETLTLNLGDER